MFGKKSSEGSQRESAATTPGNKKDHFSQANDWEASRIDSIERSERRAWKTAGAFGFAFVLAVVAIVLMMPLKKTEPFIVRVDNTTGHTDLVTALSQKGVGYDEVMDKYWLSQYVRARETYDWYTIQKDYDTVGLLSTPSVGKTYAGLYEGDNAIDKKNGASVREIVEILSVVPTGSGIGTVRFIKTNKRADDSGVGTSTRWIATIGYEYRNPSIFKESARLINPLGFQVTSYRLDPEIVGGGK